MNNTGINLIINVIKPQDRNRTKYDLTGNFEFIWFYKLYLETFALNKWTFQTQYNIYTKLIHSKL